jgi:ketosteroid isomerase-like protein
MDRDEPTDASRVQYLFTARRGRAPAAVSRISTMTNDSHVAIAQTLLNGIANGEDAETIAQLFHPDLMFEIQGDDGVLPWVGRKTGRQAIIDFLGNIRAMTEPVAFEVHDILTSERRAAIVGDLKTRIKATGKVTAGEFAIILTISEGVVTRFQMLEDSFDVSLAARLPSPVSPGGKQG